MLYFVISILFFYYIFSFRDIKIKVENKISDNYWLVFQKNGDKRIFSFFLMSDKKTSEINNIALSSYKSIKNSLIIIKKKTVRSFF